MLFEATLGKKVRDSPLQPIKNWAWWWVLIIPTAQKVHLKNI
jgi:hypothetical protein